MASKKRGGLSKREYAAAQKAKAAPKVSARPTVKKTSGIGPVASGDAYASMVSKSTKGVGPLANGDAYASAVMSSRNQASKAQKRKSSGGGSSSGRIPGAPTVLGASTSKPDVSGDLSSGDNESFFGKLVNNVGRAGASGLRAVGDLVHTPDLGWTENLGINQKLKDYGLSIPTANAQEGDISALGDVLQQSSQPDMPTGYGDSGEIFYNGGENRGSRGEMNQRNNAPYQSDPSTTRTTSIDKSSNNPSFDNDPTVAEEMNVGPIQVPSYEQQQNELYGGGPGPVDTPAPRVTNQIRGSGLFGTGKGVGNPAGEDPYIKELRKAYSSNGGEKWLRKQFDELIAQLDPTYAQYEKEGTDALNANLNNQNVQLASVMNANNTGDSEQRAQLMAGQQRDTQTAIGNLLAKLALNKSQDVSSYRSQMAGKLGEYQDRSRADQRTLIDKIQAYRDQQMGRQSSGAAPRATSEKLSHNDIFSWTNDALSKGYTWQEIAENASQQGIDTSTGSYLDQLLNNANKQNKFV